MATKMHAVAIGVFEDVQQAKQAVEELRGAGFGDDRIGVAARDQDVKEEVEKGLPDRKETYAEEGTAVGAIGGAAVGGLWGLGIAAGALPAIGPVIAGGTLAAMLALGHPLRDAAIEARRVAGDAIANGLRGIGSGPGPVDALGIAGRSRRQRPPSPLP